jgi:hypothetical protein
MRILRARINVRSVMIVVAVVAISLAIGMETGRWNRFRAVYQHTAYRHDIDEYWERERSKSYLKIAKDAERVVASLAENGRLLQGLRRSQKTRPDGEDYASRRAELAERNIRAAAGARARAAHAATSAAYHAALKRKYRGAVSRPWAAIEPDPPPPPGPAEYWPYLSDPPNQGVDLSYDEGSQMIFGYWSADELNDLAWFLATCPDTTRRDGRRAVHMAELACKLTAREKPLHLETLAAAHAECGDWKAAVLSQREALGLLASGDPNEPEYRARLERYEAKQPSRVMSKAAK